MIKYQISDKTIIHPRGFEWDDYSFGVYDFYHIANWIVSGGIHNILEIGSGLSSLLLSQLCHVDSLENSEEWCDRVGRARKKGTHDLNLFWWDGVYFPDWLPGPYDAVFIDGPEEHDKEKRKSMMYAGLPREVSFINAREMSDTIWVHDASRMAEMSYQINYLATDFRVTGIVTSDEDASMKRNLVVWKRIGT